MSASQFRHHAARSALLRAGAVAGIAATLAACAAAGSSGGATSSVPAPATIATPASPTTSAPSTSASASASSPGIPPCATSALTGAVDLTAAGAAAGSTFYPLDLTNTSASTCSLEGYPGVSFVTGPSGTQIGDPARRNPVTAPTTVTLDTGQVAHATLQVAEAGNYDQTQCMPVMAHYLRIYPPGQTAALVVPFTTQACSATLPASIGGQLGITVMQPGAS
ncbi:MAG TPA: DUF4232 domain-containing protein [Cellulomonadaceae bacterium]|nr:DUF4232 domain-containing protein [Cellulomonadaceae bacterium]